jgi:hypothetical protein
LGGIALVGQAVCYRGGFNRLVLSVSGRQLVCRLVGSGSEGDVIEQQKVNVKISECCPVCRSAFDMQIDVVMDGDDTHVPLICSECGEQFMLGVYLEFTCFTFKKVEPVENSL